MYSKLTFDDYVDDDDDVDSYFVVLRNQGQDQTNFEVVTMERIQAHRGLQVIDTGRNYTK